MPYKKFRVIQTPTKNKSSLRWFQANIEMSLWTSADEAEVLSFVKQVTGLENPVLQLGSGLQLVGMHEIFYVRMGE